MKSNAVQISQNLCFQHWIDSECILLFRLYIFQVRIKNSRDLNDERWRMRVTASQLGHYSVYVVEIWYIYVIFILITQYTRNIKPSIKRSGQVKHGKRTKMRFFILLFVFSNFTHAASLTEGIWLLTLGCPQGGFSTITSREIEWDPYFLQLM